MCWPAGRWDTCTFWCAWRCFGLSPWCAGLFVDHNAVTQPGLKLDLTLGSVSSDDGMYAPIASSAVRYGVPRLGIACARADGKCRPGSHHARDSVVCELGWQCHT